MHDFPDKELGKAIRTASTTSPRTPAGSPSVPTTTPPRSRSRRSPLVDTRRAGRLPARDPAADHRRRRGLQRLPRAAWKTELAALAADTGLSITVCHLPPGTSKWNKIEHRLFSHISMNWRGRPLTSHEVIVDTIAATTTATGLTVHADLDTGAYPTGIKIPDRT